MQIHGDPLVLGAAGFGQQFAPRGHKLGPVEQRHLGVRGHIQRDPPLLFALSYHRLIPFQARPELKLFPEEFPNAQPQVPLPVMKALQPCFFPLQLLLLAAK